MRSPLPEHYLITPEPAHYAQTPERFLSDLQASLSAGIRLVQLRSKLLAPPAFSALAKQASIVCHQRGARLIINGALNAGEYVSEIDELGADGIHLSSAQLLRCSQRPLRHGQWVSAACHTLPELQHAIALQLDFVTLSPVLHTATHPDAEPLGWERFAALSRAANAASAASTSSASRTEPMPIYALGGMQATDVAMAQSHGAHGIAAIRSLWVRTSD